MSKIGWIDFSLDDRNKVSSVLSLASEEGTLDELGIGQIRDAYSDALFLGISTIQTRAKYFITIPRVIRDFQALPLSKQKNGLQDYLKKVENDVARLLVGAHGEDADSGGIIGRTRIDRDGRPSVIYWNGLRTFDIIKTKLSLADFCRHIDASAHTQIGLVDTYEGADDKDSMYQDNLVDLPDKPNNWLEALNLRLTKTEAKFLRDKLTATSAIQNTVLAQVASHSDLMNSVLDSEADKLFPFDLLTELLLKSPKVSKQCKQNINLANQFSLAIEGPHIRYNILAAQFNSFDDKVKQYEQEYLTWQDKVKSLNLFNQQSAISWLSIINQGATNLIKPKAKDFIIGFSSLIQSNESTKVIDQLVRRRADNNKGPRSLLKKKQNNNNWIGIRRLDYRWSTAKVILKDIREGLNA